MPKFCINRIFLKRNTVVGHMVRKSQKFNNFAEMMCKIWLFTLNMDIFQGQDTFIIFSGKNWKCPGLGILTKHIFLFPPQYIRSKTSCIFIIHCQNSSQIAYKLLFIISIYISFLYPLVLSETEKFSDDNFQKLSDMPLSIDLMNKHFVEFRFIYVGFQLQSIEIKKKKKFNQLSNFITHVIKEEREIFYFFIFSKTSQRQKSDR